MAFSTFYINGNTLAEATSVFTDAALTTLAPDAYYSDGSVVRQQVGGVLLSIESCPSCETLCDTPVSVSASGVGVYNIAVNAGSSIGAVRVRISVLSIPDSVKATWDGNIYNKMSSTNFGYLNNYSGTPSSTTNPVWIGDAGVFCSGSPAPVPIPPNPPITADVYQYTNGALVPTGSTEAISVAAADIQTTPGAPGTAILYIPKTTASPNIVNFRFESICATTLFNFTAFCPAPLNPLAVSAVDATQIGACALPINQQVYLGIVNGPTDQTPTLHDWVFSNANSGVGGVNTYAAQGFYKYTHPTTPPFNRWFEVGPNGTIISQGNC